MTDVAVRPLEAVEVTNTGLVLRIVPTLDEYQQICETIGSGWRAVNEQRDRLQWAIGDLFVAGEHLFGEEVYGAVQALGMSENTIRNVSSVCRTVPRQRRRASLSFSHHDAVRALEPAEQDRLLGLAEQEGWSRTRLRDERRVLRAAHNGAEVVPPRYDICECCGRSLA